MSGKETTGSILSGGMVTVKGCNFSESERNATSTSLWLGRH